MSYGTDLLNQSLLDESKRAEDERKALMARACHAYQGTDVVINRPLKVESGDPDDNVALNYSETIVDKGVAFLFGQDLKIDIGDPVDTAESSESPAQEVSEAYLEEVWPEDIRAEDLIELGTNGGIFGHVWAKIAIENNQPSVVVGDPECYSAEWAPDNYKKVVRYLNTYRTTVNGKPVLRRENTYPVSPQAWQIDLEQSTADAPTWTVLETYPWPFPFAPVVHCKNLPTPNQFYGKADLTLHVLSLMYYINRVNSLINRIVRCHAAPKPYALGQKKVDMEIGTNKMLFLPNHEAKLGLLEMAGDLEQARNFRKDLREALSEITHVPEVTTGKTDNVGQLSGRAMRILYGPLIDQTAKKRRLYGRLIKQLVGNLLVVGQQAPAQATANGGQKVKVNVHWGDALPADDKEQAEVAVMKKQVGFSNDTLISGLGGDPDTERTQRATDASEAQANFMGSIDQGLVNDPNLGTTTNKGGKQ
jgi:hypothetical protein